MFRFRNWRFYNWGNDCYYTCWLNVSCGDHDVADARSCYNLEGKAKIIWSVDHLVVGIRTKANQEAVAALLDSWLQAKETNLTVWVHFHFLTALLLHPLCVSTLLFRAPLKPEFIDI